MLRRLRRRRVQINSGFRPVQGSDQFRVLISSGIDAVHDVHGNGDSRRDGEDSATERDEPHIFGNVKSDAHKVKAQAEEREGNHETESIHGSIL